MNEYAEVMYQLAEVVMSQPVSLDTILHACEIAAIIGTAIGGVYKLGQMTQKFETVGTQQASEITQLKNAVEALGQLRISDASDRERMNAIDQRMIMQGQRFDDAIRRNEERIIDHGKRLDTVANLINGRLEAINNIIAGHTARLDRVLDTKPSANRG